MVIRIFAAQDKAVLLDISQSETEMPVNRPFQYNRVAHPLEPGNLLKTRSIEIDKAFVAQVQRQLTR